MQKLSAEELDALQASLWLLSPPCQPYTRQGLQRDKADGRAESFLVIIERLREMRSPPTHLLVENVVGFERSETHVELLESLASLGYAAQGAVLSPTEVGVPYSRPRYFVLAKRAPLAFASEPPQRDADGFGVWREPPTQPPWHHEQYAAPGPLAGYLESEEPSDDAFHFVHESVLRKHGVVLDFVNADDRKCCCVTKNYFKFLRGTGSLVATQGSPKEVRWGVHMHSRVQGPVDAALLEAGSKAPLGEQTVRDLLALKPRYFTPREVANLHSFPPGFSFPPYITLKQRYALLGNSLSVAVLAPLIRYLLWDDHGRPPSEGVLIRAAGRSMGRGVFATRAFRKGELVLDDEEPMLRQEPLGEEGGTFDTSLRQAAEALGERNTAVACQVMAQLKAFHAIDEHVRNDILTELECGVPDEGRSHPLWRFCEAAADAYVATAAAHGGSSDAPAGLAPRPTHLAKAALAFALNAHDVGCGVSALYRRCCMINHTCDGANAEYTRQEGQSWCVYVAKRDICPGEQIHSCYYPSRAGLPTRLRRACLLATKMFRCMCASCAHSDEFGDDKDRLPCPRDDCSGMVHPSPLDATDAVATCTDMGERRWFEQVAWRCLACEQAFHPAELEASALLVDSSYTRLEDLTVSIARAESMRKRGDAAAGIALEAAAGIARRYAEDSLEVLGDSHWLPRRAFALVRRALDEGHKGHRH